MSRKNNIPEVNSPDKKSSHIKDKDFQIVSNIDVKEDEYESMRASTIEDSINLDKAEIKQSKVFGSYVAYTITNKKNEKFERRFNDFVSLRKVLVDNYPGCYIPKIPEKWQGPANRKLGAIIYEEISPSQTRPTRGSGI